MGALWAEVPACRWVAEEASDAININMLNLMAESTPEVLTQTQNAQPALLVVGLMAARYLAHATGKPLSEISQMLAGHSLGEYTAVAAAGGLGVGVAAQVVRVRGESMAKATGGAMAAVLGLEVPALETALEACPGVVIANDNSPGQVVISGPAEALQAAEPVLKQAGAKRLVPLAVSGAFHTPAMAPAAQAVALFLAAHPVQGLAVPVVANATAQPAQRAAEVQANLVAQVTGRVRWRESMNYAAAHGITQVVELGVGKVLSGLATRCHAGWQAVSLTSPAEADAWLNTLHTQR